MNISQILKLAGIVRKACIKARRKEVFNKEYVQINLKGACAIASYVLNKKLQEEGYESTLIFGTYSGMIHCWVKLNNLNIDVTATQFLKQVSYNLPDIYISSDNNYSVMKSGEEAFEIVRFWEEQSPTLFDYIWKNNKLIIKNKEI